MFQRLRASRSALDPCSSYRAVLYCGSEKSREYCSLGKSCQRRGYRKLQSHSAGSGQRVDLQRMRIFGQDRSGAAGSIDQTAKGHRKLHHRPKPTMLSLSSVRCHDSPSSDEY